MSSLRTAIDLFAGAGGASEGLEQAGIKVISANELNSTAAMTYHFNHPKTKLIVRDIKKVTSTELLNGRSGVDLLFAGLPCQGFSNAGKKDMNDIRNYLFVELMRLAKKIKPRFILIENVAGLLASRNNLILSNIENKLSKMGYHVSKRVFDTSLLGVPQKRRRVLILASKNNIDLAQFKFKTSGIISVQDAISDLEFLRSGASDNYVHTAKTGYQKRMRRTQKTLFNHETSTHSRKVAKRFSKLTDGQIMRTAMPRVHTKKRYAIKLKRTLPAPTVTTMPDDYIHYSLPRILTVREMARLQSFRDSYVFLGPRTTGGKLRKKSAPQYTQVGNAVPPIFLKKIAEWLASL